MKKITEIDKNMQAKAVINKDDIVYYDIKENRFCLYGLMCDDIFHRMTQEASERVSEEVSLLQKNTAGGRLRFVTDSEYLSLVCRVPEFTHLPNMPLTGTSAFDVYVDGVYNATFYPTVDATEGFEACAEFGSRKMREITVNFPLYNCVSEFYIGIRNNAVFEAAPEYKYKKPVLFYGSSITQGGCASRPGNSYPNIISRMLDCDIINFGFSGSAKGEDAMAEYIAQQDISVFVMDYDYNAPTDEHLKNTHERFFKIFRDKQPFTPVVFVSAPNVRHTHRYLRRDIIRTTYENALAGGDKNVYYIDGETLFGTEEWDACTVDACHPNDLGMLKMAKTIAPVVGAILQ